jgi:hypothetical protein
MKIAINPFDKESIIRAIAQLKQYEKDFHAKEKEFVRRLAELGVSVASVGFVTADYDGVNDVVVTLEHKGTRAAVVASGTTVGFIEFGTGVRNPEWDNTGMEYTPPKHGTYGKGHGKRAHGWYFKPNGSEGASQHTYGNQPAEAMRTARDVMVERVAQIAREVWR